MNWNWLSSIVTIFMLQMVYLAALSIGAALYLSGGLTLPSDFLGLVPLGVPWFGALGAVLISLGGIFKHAGVRAKNAGPDPDDWDRSYWPWHWSRPLVGANLGIVSFIIFQSGLLAVGSTPAPTGATAPQNLLYYVIAFVVGYREESFRELIKRVADVILRPGELPTPPPATTPVTTAPPPATTTTPATTAAPPPP